jgi:hypothetical protein
VTKWADLTPEQRAARKKQLGSIIDEALAGSRKDAPRSEKRHPAEVTSDRLGDAASKWNHLMTGGERDALAQVRQVLAEIADGTRSNDDYF